MTDYYMTDWTFVESATLAIFPSTTLQIIKDAIAAMCAAGKTVNDITAEAIKIWIQAH